MFFENSFYLFHFSCGLVPYHHTKFRLKFTCSKLTIETLEQGLKYVQS